MGFKLLPYICEVLSITPCFMKSVCAWICGFFQVHAMDVNLQNVLWLMTWMGSVRLTIFFLWRLIRNLSPLNKPCTGYYNTDDQIFFPTVSHTLHLLIHPFRSCNAAVILTHPEKRDKTKPVPKSYESIDGSKFMFLSLAKCSVFFKRLENLRGALHGITFAANFGTGRL